MSYARKKASSNYVNERFLTEDCAVSGAFDEFSGRWTTQVLFCVYFGLNRFGLIKLRLPRISDQILGLRLKQLVKQKLVVKRKAELETVYEITPKAERLLKLLDELADWHKKWR